MKISKDIPEIADELNRAFWQAAIALLAVAALVILATARGAGT